MTPYRQILPYSGQKPSKGMKMPNNTSGLTYPTLQRNAYGSSGCDDKTPCQNKAICPRAAIISLLSIQS